MQDWVFTGALSQQHSEDYADAFYDNLVCDQPCNPFTNARLFAEHYGALRKRALERPTAVGDTLIPQPAVWPTEEGNFTNFKRLPKATVPSGFLPAEKRSYLPLPSNAQFCIVECLSTGPNRFSQTFKARTVPKSEPDELIVVLKICQESLARNAWLSLAASPADLEKWETTPAPQDWQPLWLDAATEAAAYEHLETLQGTVLPWYYGAFSVREQQLLLPS
jgi:hypothetical protein